MASSGPNSPASASNDTTSGSHVWLNPQNVYVSDTNYAENQSSAFTTYYLKTSQHGFAIPSDATVNGIVVEYRRAQPNPSYVGYCYTVEAQLAKGGVIAGDNKSLGTSAKYPYNSAFAYETYGGSSDLWGLTFTASDINSSNFGFAMTTRMVPFKGGLRLLVDHIRITVYYTESGGPSSAISSVGNVSYSNASNVSKVNKANISKIINIV